MRGTGVVEFGVLVRYESTVRACCYITVERDALGDCWVRTRTGGVITKQEGPYREIHASERFDRIVEAHAMCEALA
jgi:hypothetical protein